MIQAAILDLGGVIFQLDFLRMMRRLGLSPDATNDSTMRKLDHWEIYDQFERGQIETPAFFEKVRENLHPHLDFDGFIEAWNSVFVGVVPGVEDILLASPLPLYALSNTTPPHIEHMKNHYSVLKSFKHVFTSVELGCRKPEPQIYEKVSDTLQIPPQGLLFVDDREENITAAHGVGYHAEHCFNSSSRLAEILAAIR